MSVCAPCQAFSCPLLGGTCPGSLGPARNTSRRLESQVQRQRRGRASGLLQGERRAWRGGVGLDRKSGAAAAGIG